MFDRQRDVRAITGGRQHHNRLIIRFIGIAMSTARRGFGVVLFTVGVRAARAAFSTDLNADRPAFVDAQTEGCRSPRHELRHNKHQ